MSECKHVLQFINDVNTKCATGVWYALQVNWGKQNTIIANLTPFGAQWVYKNHFLAFASIQRTPTIKRYLANEHSRISKPMTKHIRCEKKRIWNCQKVWAYECCLLRKIYKKKQNEQNERTWLLWLLCEINNKTIV